MTLALVALGALVILAAAGSVAIALALGRWLGLWE
jgi:hypothetical protein